MTEPTHLGITRAAYDTVAVDYADLLRDELASRPLDRALLTVFAETVRAGTDGRGGLDGWAGADGQMGSDGRSGADGQVGADGRSGSAGRAASDGRGGADGRVGDGAGPAGGGPRVADIGCGPGRVTGFLRDAGLDVFGVDLSPQMVAVARREHPDLRFEVGTMTDLTLPDGSLAGIVAWYSIIHLPPDLLPGVFAGFHRVLAPGGHLLLAFKAGDERVRLEQAYGHRVSYDVHRLPPERIAGQLRDAGFTVTTRVLREPQAYERTRQAFLLAERDG
ncbi:class I SAM-dependent DNA methyltransferase [Micromonospora yangpuensis]|uniref:Ubiquinone/menaquinone biosynthesis C-methylase UbiE n=1 Tax=Micromonospora yangpuensis TaxID=683228 RepID=A0A1C6UDN7_9ACTN|nr:class I SAM-dependent methyltransferase [Micromonospora yangpuensis]GGM26761.1 hypothetical protein GCM10012279_51580 [Micromonospora yangpuensis]SCL51969.1 Ubiquinone/menaquinone biosynthesis C-methylase UbiE [Micromonospora yangpuensis]